MIKLLKALFLLLFTLSFCFIKKGYADSPLTPLWTSEDTVTVPVVITQDVSSDGKYTLVTLQRTSLTDGNATQSSDCVLINNKNLEIKTINKIDQSCMQLQFIGEGKKFSYIFYNDKDKKSALFVHDVPSQETVQVQEFKEGFYNYSFAPDEKSFAFILQENPKKTQRIKEDDGQKINQRLYLQKVNEKFQPVGDPQFLTPAELNLYNSLFAPSYQWSPDSQKIAVTASTPGWKSLGRGELYVIDLKEDKIEKINEEMGYCTDLNFSSDSQKLAFIKDNGAGDQKLPLKPLIAQQPKRIRIFDLRTNEEVSLPAVDIWHISGWKKDNKSLIVTKQEGTKQQVYSLDIATQKLTLMEVPNLTSIHNVILSQNQNFI